MDKRVYWSDHLKSWLESGVSGKSYCTTHNLKYANFMRWKKVLSLESREPELGYFTELTADSGELDFYINDIHLRVQSTVSATALGRIIQAVLRSAKAC